MAALGSGPMAAVVGVIAFLCVLLIGVVAGERRRHRRFRRRLARIQRSTAAGRPDGGAARRSLSAESPTPGLDRLAARWLPRQEILRNRLERVGRGITIGHYLVGMATTALVSFTLFFLVLPFGVFAAAMLALPIAIGVPHMVVGYLGRKRNAQFLALFPDAIDLMVRALRSGLPITEAIITVGHELADPVGSEFRRVEQALKLGRTLDEVLAEVAQRLDTPEFGFFVISLSVQRQTGGNLGETLANLGEILRRRRQMRQKIKAISAEARMSALILGILPFAVGLLIFVTSPKYLMPLFTTIGGQFLCGIGATMLVIGTTIMARLIRFEI